MLVPAPLTPQFVRKNRNEIGGYEAEPKSSFSLCLIPSFDFNCAIADVSVAVVVITYLTLSGKASLLVVEILDREVSFAMDVITTTAKEILHVGNRFSCFYFVPEKILQEISGRRLKNRLTLRKCRH